MWKLEGVQEGERLETLRSSKRSEAIGFKPPMSYSFTTWSQSCVLLVFVSCVAGTELPTLSREWEAAEL